MRRIALLLLVTCAMPAVAQDAAQTLLEAGRLPEAIQELEGALGDNPFDPAQLNNLAAARVRAGDYYTALSLLGRAARLAPDNAVIGDNRERLREWLAQRIGAAGGNSLPAVAMPEGLPEPPALWDR